MSQRAKTPEQFLRENLDFTESTIIEFDQIGVVSLRGEAIHENAHFKLSITRNDEVTCLKKSLYTGTISLLSQVSGSVMCSEARRKNREQKGLPCDDAKSTYATTKFQLNSTDVQDFVDVLNKRMTGLFLRNKAQFDSDFLKMITADDITPLVAFEYYGRDFIASEYSHLPAEKREKHLEKLRITLGLLPNRPFLGISKKDVNKSFAGKKVSAVSITLCDCFFVYLVRCNAFRSNRAAGSPFRNVSATTTSAASARRKELSSLSIPDAVYANLFQRLSESHSLEGIALALMLSGFSYTDLTRLRLQDIEFVDKYDDFALVHLFKEELVSAKHDYSRPCIPDVARYLKAAVNAIVANNPDNNILKRPILERDDGNPLTNKDLSLLANNWLVLAGYRESLSMPGRNPDNELISLDLLRTNYRNRLSVKAGLANDFDTFNFLSGLQLRSSTFTHYESHTSPEAQYRLYTILKSLDIPRTIPKKRTSENERERTIYAVPTTTADAAVLSGSITLQPGEMIIIRCPHGVSGSVSAQGVGHSSSRRKGRKRAATGQANTVCFDGQSLCSTPCGDIAR